LLVLGVFKIKSSKLEKKAEKHIVLNT